MPKTNTTIPRIAAQLATLGQAQITQNIGDRITRAHLLQGDPHTIALDTNARLVTHLRKTGIWPKR